MLSLFFSILEAWPAGHPLDSLSTAPSFTTAFLNWLRISSLTKAINGKLRLSTSIESTEHCMLLLLYYLRSYCSHHVEILRSLPCLFKSLLKTYSHHQYFVEPVGNTRPPPLMLCWSLKGLDRLKPVQEFGATLSRISPSMAVVTSLQYDGSMKPVLSLL